MVILILGAGALGSLIGARLSQTDARVLLLTTDRQHIQAVLDRGLIVEELNGDQSRFFIPGYFDHRDITETADLVIVTVKSYDTATAVGSIANCCHDSTLFLTLQNGIGNWERISQLTGTESVLAGSTAQGATMVGPGRIRHGGNGQTFIGEFNEPPSERVRQLIDLFGRAQLETRASDQMQKLIWEKLLINVGINAITALTGIHNGSIAERSSARELSQAAVQEALEVARKKGFAIADEIVERVVAVAKATARNRSSMGQDVDRRKRTEIDAINGAIVEFGQETGIATPVNYTLTQLVRTVEAGYLMEKEPKHE